MIPLSTPQDTISRLAALPSDRTLIVDLDHTLHRSSSTEQFIDMARPATLAATGLAALGALKPWRLSADPAASRDHMRVLFIVIFFPWTILRWRRHAASDDGWNTDLLEVVKSHQGPVVVASNGFRIAVSPRVRQVLPEAMVTARSVLVRSPRARDKYRRVVDELGDEVVAHSAVVTDSEDDNDLLEACGSPFLLQWPNAFWSRALAEAYIPLQYSAAKHTKRSVLWAVFLDDLPIAILVTTIGSRSPLRAAMATFVLLVASRCVYDSGYNENDHLNHRAEPDPTLQPKALDYKNSVPPVPVIVWVAGLIATAVLIASPNDLIAPFDGAASRRMFAISIAAVVLITLRITFFVFNRLTPHHRRWVHPVLQLCRYGLYASVLSVNLVGILALSAQLIHRTVPYAIYRSPKTPDQYPAGRWALLRLVIFAVSAAVSIPFSSFSTITFVPVLIWFAFRAKADVRLRTNS